MNKREENKQTNTEWKHRMKDGCLYITFQGTTSFLDILQNFMVWIKPYRDMPVRWYAHRGFLRKWKSIREEVFNLIKERKPREIRLKGHSQGGAIAILAHEDIRFHDRQIVIKTVTQGAPRTVWFYNLHRIKDRFSGIYNYQNRDDLIPHLPPSFLGYRHVGSVIKQGTYLPFNPRSHIHY